MNVKKLFEFLVSKDKTIREIESIFWWLSFSKRAYSKWDGKEWELISSWNSDKISIKEYV